MNFKPDFRKFTDESHPESRIREMKSSPLILIKGNGEATYATTRTEKDKLVENFDEKNDLLLFAWAGQWTTDIFQLTKKDISKYYQRI